MNYTAIKASITNSSTRASFRHKTMALVLSLVLLIVLIPIPKADALNPSYTPSTQYRTSSYYSALTALTLTGNNRTDLIEVAKTQIGYHEGNSTSDLGGGNSSGSGNYTEYGYWYGMQDQWCAMFVSWCLRQAGVPNSVVQSHASCTNWVSWFQTNATYYTRSSGYVPASGDIIFFKSDAVTRASDHVGIVNYVSGNTVYTIEGNSSNQVRTRSYALSDTYIVGYGIPAYTSDVATVPGVYKITASALNVRSGPSTSYNIITTLSQNDTVIVYEISNNWGRIYVNGTDTGWISMNYASFVSAVSSSIPGVYKITASTLNVRSGPSTSYDIISTLSQNATVVVHELNNNWGKIYINGSEGWISMNYASLQSSALYTVVYDANGGTGAPAPQTKLHGADLTLSNTLPVKPGYTFACWALSPNTLTCAYGPGSIYTNNASVTLYAVWIDQITYTVTYDANGGTGAPAPQAKIHNEDLILSSVQPTREGYTFAGWGLSPDTMTCAYGPGYTYTANEPVTLYAVWINPT